MEGEPAHMTCSRKMHENTVYSYVRNREWLIGFFVKARAPVSVSIRLTRGGWAEGGPGQTSLNECPAGLGQSPRCHTPRCRSCGRPAKEVGLEFSSLCWNTAWSFVQRYEMLLCDGPWWLPSCYTL